MTPDNVCGILRRVSLYIDSTPNPNKGAIISALSNVFYGLQNYSQNRVSADLRKFTQSEFDEADSKMSDFIGRLDKVVNSLNPQDHERAKLEKSVSDFKNLHQMFQTEFKELNVSI